MQGLSMDKTIYTKEYRKIISLLQTTRIEAGLTQLDVATKLNRPQSYVSKSESCERRLDFIELLKFAKIYKKSINYFIKD